MKEPSRLVISGLMLLTFVTGLVDAASVLGLDHVFTANMTGNVVFLGFALAGRGVTSVAASLNALGGFLLGALVGGRVAKTLTATAIKRAFAVEVLVLTGATLLASRRAPTLVPFVVSLLAIAMGLRNALVRKLAVPDMTTTVLTLTVTGLAADSSLAGGNNARWPRRVVAVLVMLGGAASGAGLLAFGEGWVIGVAAALEAVAVTLLCREADALAASRKA